MKSHKYLMILLFILLIVVVADGVISTDHPIPGLTQKHTWDCETDPTDPDITLALTAVANYTYETQDGLDCMKVHMKGWSGTYPNLQYVQVGLPYGPGVEAMDGYVWVPEQYTPWGAASRYSLHVSFNLASASIIFQQAPGSYDLFRAVNNTDAFPYQVPRAPREEWLHFIISGQHSVGEDYMKMYIKLESLDGRYNQRFNFYGARGSSHTGYFNFRVESNGRTNWTCFVDELVWYQQFYNETNHNMTFEYEPVYFVGDSVMQKWILWEASYDLPHARFTDPYYCDFFDYAANFTVKRAMVYIYSDYATAIPAVLAIPGIEEIWFASSINLPDVYDAVSTAAVSDSRIKGFCLDDYSSLYGTGTWTLENITLAKSQLNAHTHVQLFGVMYPNTIDDVNASGYAVLDGCILTIWTRHDLYGITDALNWLAANLTNSTNIIACYYTNDYGMDTYDAQPIGCLRWWINRTNELYQAGRITHIMLCGPARGLNYDVYTDTDGNYFCYEQGMTNRWFANITAVEYDSTGTTITILKQRDELWVNYTYLEVPLLVNGSEYHVVLRDNMTIHLFVPSGMDPLKIQVYDYTDDQIISWTGGSVVFVGEYGHEYIISELWANFTYSSSGRSVSFVDNSYYDIDSWLWDFDDGSTSTEQNPNHRFDEPGDYDVTLTVTDEYGSTNSTTVEIHIPTDAEQIDLLIPVMVAAMGIVVVVSVLSNGMIRPFNRMFRRIT